MPILMTIFFVLARIISNSYAGVFQKKLAEKYNASYINVLNYFLLTLFCFSGFKFFDFSNKSLFLYVILTGITGAIGNALQIKALKIGELSILAPINSYKIIFSLIFSFFLLKEIPNSFSFFGIFLIIFGSYFIFETTQEGFSFKLLRRKDIQYRIFAVFFTGLEAIFIKEMILCSNSTTALFFWALSSAIFSLFLMKMKRYKFEKLNLDAFKLLLYLTLCMGIMQLSTNYLFKAMNVSYALSLFQLSSLLSVVLGYKIFNEKELKKKILGAFIMVIGATIIILFK